MPIGVGEKVQLSGKGDEVILEQCGAFITNTALAFVLSQSEEHLELVRKWALDMCRLDAGKYGLGAYAAGLARAYDWLYESWSESERSIIRKSLARYVEQLFLNSMPESGKGSWWAGFHLHLDFWVPVAGFGEAALALLGEAEDAALWAAHARLELDQSMACLGDDGCWHEGPGGWCYAVSPLLMFYGAWFSVVGEDLHDNPWIRYTAAYRLYHRLPDNSYMYLNDSWRSGRYGTSGSAACHLLRRLASLFRDGHAQWLADRDEEFDLLSGPKGVIQAPYELADTQSELPEYPHPHAEFMAWNFLWFDPAVESAAPNGLPHSRYFTNGSLAILKTGWDENGAIVSFTCGPPGGHAHAERVRKGKSHLETVDHAHLDCNSITLFAKGRYILIPPGYGRRSSRYQNTVAVNGCNLRADATIDACIEACIEEPDFCYASGNASDAFEPGCYVTDYRRRAVMFGDSLILFDDLELAERRLWRDFQWKVHSDPREHVLSLDGRSAQWRPVSSDSPALSLVILAPHEFAWENAVIQDRSGVSMLEALRLVVPEFYSQRMQVVAVLSWEESPSEPEVIRHWQFLGVWWPDDPDRSAVLFALAEIEESDVTEAIPKELISRTILIFGHQPEKPGKFLRLG